MNNLVHSAPQSKKAEQTLKKKKESHAIKQAKIHNNLKSLEKYIWRTASMA